jgi:hypothetical protein
MALKIHKASDPIEVTQIKMLVYGQPGIGKSSFGFTADAPLTLDFDDGARRSSFRQDIVQIATWADANSITAEDLKPYRTIVVDTVGRALDFIAASLIADNPKNANKSGGLTLPGFGALKSSFTSWLTRLNTLGKDVVMIAHDKESTNERDIKIVRPDVTGGSYNEIFKLADSVGYMYSTSGKKYGVLDFNPTENYVGKNPAQFEPIIVPDYLKEPRFAADLIAKVKGALGSISEESRKIVEAVTRFRADVDGLTEPAELTKLIEGVNALEEPVKSQCKFVLKQRTDVLGLVFNKDTKAFEPAKASEAA